VQEPAALPATLPDAAPTTPSTDAIGMDRELSTFISVSITSHTCSPFVMVADGRRRRLGLCLERHGISVTSAARPSRRPQWKTDFRESPR
jgi:hypothetical protein